MNALTENSKIPIPGYRIAKLLYKSSFSLYFHGHDLERDRKVIIRFFKKKQLSNAEITQFKSEYAFMQELSGIYGIPTPLQMEITAYGPAMILKFFDGKLLSDILQQNEAGTAPKTAASSPYTADPLEYFLSIAIPLTEALAALHRRGFIHQQIQPEHIVWNEKTGQIRIIDLSNVKKSSRHYKRSGIKNIAAGNLSYISPEQTGRTDCVIDFRSDLYSLGVIFYRMATGILPFHTDDAMQIIHAHIAQIPDAPEAINPDIPGVVSEMILKLMAKNPEDRYQSAYGLLADLKKCREQLKARIIDFDIGQADIADTLKIPEKIYGREAALAKLRKAFDRCAGGSPEAILLTGDAGIGKSRLLEAIAPAVLKSKAFFISIAFDPQTPETPYSAIILGIRALIRHLLTLDESDMLYWKGALINALGDTYSMIAAVVPELESITGISPVPPASSESLDTDPGTYFYDAFHQLISLFAAPAHPLLIFIDNLQWATSEDLAFVDPLLTRPGRNYCLFVLACREDGKEAAPASDRFKKTFTAAGIAWDTLRLSPLSTEAVDGLLSEMLSFPTDSLQDLSKIVRAKTGGNPFFIFQFIQTLYKNGHIHFDGTWHFHLPAIAQADITENLADFMALQLQKRSGPALEILQTAACIGVHFNPEVIARATGRPHTEIAEIIAQAIQDGLLVATEPGAQFSHERIRDAAYAGMDEQTRAHCHQQIGRALLMEKNKKQIDQNIFEIVYHLRQTPDAVIQAQDRADLAGYNFSAATAARASGAYQSALRYLRQAISLLPENPWAANYAQTLAFYSEICEVAFLTGAHEHIDPYYAGIMENAKAPCDKIRAGEVKIAVLTTANQPADAIALCLELLQMLGLRFPAKASKSAILFGFIRSRILLRRKSSEDLLDLPAMRDPTQLAIVRILMRMAEPCYVENPDLLILSVFKTLILTLKHGDSGNSAFAYATYGAILCGAFDAYAKGLMFGNLALKTIDRFKADHLKAKVNLLIGAGIHHWSAPLREDLNYLMASYNSGLESGDHSFAAYGLTCYMYTLFFLGEPLDHMAKKYTQYFGAFKNIHQESSFQEFLLWYQIVENLQHKDGPLSVIKGRICNEDDYVSHWEQVNDLNRLGIHNIGKMILFYMAGNMDACLHCAVKGKKYLSAIMGQIFVVEYFFYYSLALIASAETATPRMRRHYKRKIMANQKKIAKWAQQVPDNFEHKYLLIDAGLAAMAHSFEKAMILFNASITQAANQGFLQDEAIANEVAGKIWQRLNNAEIAAVFMTRAYRCYQKWGATAKLTLLEKHYAGLLNKIKTPFPDDWQNQTAARPAENRQNAAQRMDIAAIDVATVVQAAQTISEEIILERLIHQLIRLNIETAGAEKGGLLLKENEGFVLQALGRLQKDGIQVSRPAGNLADRVPISIIRFVGRTGETVLLSDAAKEKLFANDPYILAHAPKSILCIPVMHQHHLSAVMYLENNLAEGVFTPQRQEILKILASQAAISIDNALLYEELKDTEQRFSHLLKTANEGFLSIDRKAVITDVNPEMCRILGRKRHTLIGMSYYDFLDAQGNEMVKNQLKFRLQGIKGAYDISFTRPEGTRVDCLVKAAPLFDKSQKIIGSFAMVTDITERKRAETELMTLNKELEQRVHTRTLELEESLESLKKAQEHMIQSEKMAALGGLVAGVTHEINTPIGMGVTASSFLEETLMSLHDLYQSENLSADTFEKKITEAIDASATIKTNLKRAVELVGSFKEIAVDQSSEKKRPFNIKEYLDEVLISLQPKFKRTRHEVIIACPEQLVIKSDPGAFSQIITNLIVNSLTHAFDDTDNGKINIHIHAQKHYLIIHYQDNGCGMPPETAAKIFDPFFTTRRSSGGTGLGMYIVYNIVTQTLGGSIECSSHPDQGMHIHIQLPMEQTNDMTE